MDENAGAVKTIFTTHKNADFDALASVTAGSLLYPGGVPLLPRQVNPNVKAFLSLHKDIFGWLEQPAPSRLPCASAT